MAVSQILKGNLGIILLIFMCLQPSTCQSCSSAFNRLPENSDMIVTCGPSNIQLSINVCPVYFANFLPNLLALNGKHNLTECMGVMDNSTEPPVLKFTQQLDDSNSNTCGNIIEIINDVGTGYFSQYSNVQTVSISGFVDSLPLTEMGLVSYSTNLYYNFSCHYPLQYLMNNTELLTSFGAVAVNNNNGSFLGTLRMQIFTDENFTTETTTNGTTFQLKKKIYVQVSSNNTAMSYVVHLDQCYATPNPVVTNVVNESYPLISGCVVQNRTTIISNGQGSNARFSFEAFRFLQYNGQQTSSIYLHCFTRLCLYDQCPKCTGSRKRREAKANTEPVVVSLGPIYMREAENQGSSVSSGEAENQGSSVSSGGTSVTVGLIIAIFLGMWF
ncbi:zona pellucida-like domain-containing protein 1 [Hyla sarda]|uniref:zona pellucida-like domain-containing protein 1 n=1 Tax=Hyla sarda TaxID=327740 RepID=UPI0024C42837|nr:zona pellucida-like domain-containing protein 1 [Hyla sarda]